MRSRSKVTAGQTRGRYAAFISYSHRDAAVARRIHRWLERYQVPRRLVGGEGRHGPVSARVAPVFRDREDLPAGCDLSATVRRALEGSASLIVICSPAAAQSSWVAREIALFGTLHPDRPILAAIIVGDPTGSFPPGLVHGGRDPLAADLRANADGWRLGMLKLVAGLAGVDLDALVQRDAQRRLRSVMAITVTAVLGMLAMALLTLATLSARQEADRQRAQAEGLVEFMLSELRQKLKGVGRLDVLADVNARALSYYEGQRLEKLTPDSLERRARIFHAIGEDAEIRGQRDFALEKFRSAHAATARLLAQAPNDPERIFTHAQSEFWIGYVEYQRRRYAAARPAFMAYKALADRLVAIAPGRADYRREAGYAEGNLCSLALAPPPQPPEAVRACSAALAQMDAAERALPDTQRSAIQADIANRLAWLGDALRLAGRTPEAHRLYARQEAIMTRLIAADPRNLDLRDRWLTLQFTFAERADETGDRAEARKRLRAALPVVRRMIGFDPRNDLWRRRERRILDDLKTLSVSPK